MSTFINLSNYFEWSLIITIISLLLVILSFILSWKNRFRLVGISGFMIVLTVGLFGLNIGLLNRHRIITSSSSSRVYDNASDQIVISVEPSITEEELFMALREAAQNYFVYGRSAGKDNQLTLRARVLLHVNEKEDLPLYLGKAEQKLNFHNDNHPEINIQIDKNAFQTLSQYLNNMNLS